MVTISPPITEPQSHPDPSAEPMAPRGVVVRLLRYAAVSLVATATTMASLAVMVGLVGMSATWSNVVATAIGTVPSFELNRRWVWARSDRRSVIRQIVPFCTLAAAGLVISTVAVGVVADHTANWTRPAHTLAVELANLAVYGSLWIIQYQLLNRVLFAKQPSPLPPRGPHPPAFTADRQTPPSSAASLAPMVTERATALTSLTRRSNSGTR